MEELKRKTSAVLVPTSSTMPSVSPIPTVIPNPAIYQVASDAGKQTLWVVFVIMLISSLVFYGLAWRVPAKNRLYHVITALITTFATISYYAMATGDGYSFVTSSYKIKHKSTTDTVQVVHREVYWARYVDWSVTTPLLLLDLAFLAGMSGADIVVALAADIIMVLTGLFAAFVGDQHGKKWGYYAMGCIAYLVIIYQLAFNGRKTVHNKDSTTATFFTSIAAYTLVLWTLYPVIWGVADGSHKVGVDGEILAYAILDVLAKPLFGVWLLVTHARVPATNVPLDGFWAHGLGREGTLRVGDDDEGA